MDKTDHRPSDAQKLHFLRSRLARPTEASGLAPLVETHMSWVVLGADEVLKLKKPVRYPFLDFSTLEARERDAQEELHLNRRLAPQVYLDVLALQWDAGEFSLVPHAQAEPHRVVDWLVLMQRLPSERMLDRMLQQHALQPVDRLELAEMLVRFYRHAPIVTLDAHEHLRRLHAELAVHREVLTRPEFGLAAAAGCLDRAEATLVTHESLLAERVQRGRIVEGHGDLRPEHVCLTDPPVVIDAIEFNPALRRVDPIDELAFLGLECALLGDSQLGPWLLDHCMQALDDPVPAVLVRLYTACRALLRARLSAAHLLDDAPRTPDKWLPQARRYLDQAATALVGL